MSCDELEAQSDAAQGECPPEEVLYVKLRILNVPNQQAVWYVPQGAHHIGSIREACNAPHKLLEQSSHTFADQAAYIAP